MKAAAENLTPVTLELGGKTPVIVAEDADIPLAAKRIAWGKGVNTGQSCIAPDYIFVHTKVKKQLTEAISQEFTKSYGTNIQQSPDFGRIINERHTLRLQALIEAHKKDIVFGGKVDQKDKFIEPTILHNIQPTSPIMKSEIFGPILPMIDFEKIDNVIEYINNNPKPLALYVFSTNKAFIDNILAKTSSGGVTVNDTILHFTNLFLPFGGVGTSGMGRYHGKYGFQAFSHEKGVLRQVNWMDQPIRYAPFNASYMKILKFVPNLANINSNSFKRFFWTIMFPVFVGVVSYSSGLTIGFRSNL